jgi:hypothetical protein
MNLVLKFGSKIIIMIFGHLSDIGFANGTKLSLNSAVLRRIEALRNKDKNKSVQPYFTMNLILLRNEQPFNVKPPKSCIYQIEKLYKQFLVMKKINSNE